MSALLGGAKYRARLTKRLLNHYYALYTIYLASVILIGTVALCASHEKELNFINSLYLAVSAVTMTGLSPVDFAACFWYTHFVVYLLILLGSPTMLSIVPVALRRWGASTT